MSRRQPSLLRPNPYTSEKTPPLSRFGRDENVASGSLKCAFSRCSSWSDRSEFKEPAPRSLLFSIVESSRRADPMEIGRGKGEFLTPVKPLRPHFR